MRSLRLHLFVLGCILVSLPSCSWAAACLPFGETQTGTITSAGQSNSCTFSANANDVVDFTMATTSGILSPEIQVYNPSGQVIASASNGFCEGSTIELNTVTLLLSATYTVVVSDCSGANTGNYALYMQKTDNPPRASNLPLGQTKAGDVTSAAQSNTYTFSANASDVIDLTMVATSGSLSPKIRLYSPTGQLVGSANNGFCEGSTIELNAVTLPATGTYAVLVGDCPDTNTGNYDIYAQRTNSPSGAASLPFNVARTGTISSAAQSNSYTFVPNANGVIDFTMVTTSGSLSPRIRLYNPAGQLVGSASNGFCEGSAIELNTVTLPASGTYTVLVGDCSDTNTGNYEIYTQLTENPVGAANLPFGQTQTSAISSAAQSNTYTFGANANDVVDFTMVTTSGNLSPRVRVYNGAGELIASASNGFCEGSTIELNTVTLSLSDTYTVLAGDCSDTNTGNYMIYAQRVNNPSGAAMLLFGQTQSGNVASGAQSNSYVFMASAGDVVDLTIAATSGSFSPRIRLYNSAGQLVSSGSNGFCEGSTLELNTVTLKTSGTYTLLAADCSDTNTGNYMIYGQRTNSSFGPAALLFGGQTQAGNIVSAAQSNTFTFSGAANNVVDLTMVTTSGNLSPRIRLYSPTGALIGSANNGFCEGSTIELNSITLPLDGIYAVLTSDCSDTSTGNYNLSAQCFGTCPVMPAIVWANPTAITHGTRLSATQLDATSPVAGTFTYSPAVGTLLAAGPQNLTVTFSPHNTAEYSTAMDSVQLTVRSAVDITLAPTSAGFGKQALNTTSAAKVVTLTNTGRATVDISGISASADFAISANTCGTTLAAGDDCQVSVTFTPTQAGALAGALRFDDNVPNSPQTVALSGLGVAP
jgi:hypothetical protein